MYISLGAVLFRNQKPAPDCVRGTHVTVLEQCLRSGAVPVGMYTGGLELGGWGVGYLFF